MESTTYGAGADLTGSVEPISLSCFHAIVDNTLVQRGEATGQRFELTIVTTLNIEPWWSVSKLSPIGASRSEI